MNRSIAAVGDVTSQSTWSGIPWFFWQACLQAGFATVPWRPDLQAAKKPRLFWNLKRLLVGKKSGGFQYSTAFLDLLEQQVPRELKQSEVITFHQHFPRARTIQSAGGVISHYVDAPFAALVTGRGLDLKIPQDIVRHGLEAEKENYALSQRVITMGRWAADVMREECGVDAAKLHTILPGANMALPTDWTFPNFREGAGRTRDFVLGFVGKEWERKGLPRVLDLRDELARRGWRVAVHAAGLTTHMFEGRTGLRNVGFIHKLEDPARFLAFLVGCDLGCLFSQREALGISTLEFLRAGVPVAGFAHEGIADTLPPDAGFRFDLSQSISEKADILDDYLKDEAKQYAFYQGARCWSPLLSWDRCVQEFQELWETSTICNPVRPWLGLASQPNARS